MSTAVTWNASNSRQVTAATRTKWGDVRLGLNLAVIGDLVFLGLGLLGLMLVGPAGASTAARLGLDTSEDVVTLGWLVVCAGALPGYGLLVLGRWRCLVSAPQGHGAKDFQFACLLCSLLAPACFAAAHFLGGKATYLALERGLGGLTSLNPLSKGVLLQYVGLLVGLLGVVLFGAFAGALTRCLRGPSDPPRGSLSLWLIGFLVGGTVGVFLQPHRVLRDNTLSVLAVIWLICLLWQTLLIRGTSRYIARVLRQRESRVATPTIPVEKSVEAGQVSLRSAAYLRGEW
jgi:hypothetical protein